MKFYFAGGGYLGGGDPLWGSPPIIEALDLFLAMLGDTQVPWAVAVLGGSLLDTPIACAALERGGHLRVGIEDWDDGPSNLEQVEAAVVLLRGKPDARSRRSPKLSICLGLACDLGSLRVRSRLPRNAQTRPGRVETDRDT